MAAPGGPDQLFSQGASIIDCSRLQVITPYTGHRKKTNLAKHTISLDEVAIVEATGVIYQPKSNKKTENLIDQLVAAKRNNLTINAAYFIRDTI